MNRKELIPGKWYKHEHSGNIYHFYFVEHNNKTTLLSVRFLFINHEPTKYTEIGTYEQDIYREMSKSEIEELKAQCL